MGQCSRPSLAARVWTVITTANAAAYCQWILLNSKWFPWIQMDSNQLHWVPIVGLLLNESRITPSAQGIHNDESSAAAKSERMKSWRQLHWWSFFHSALYGETQVAPGQVDWVHRGPDVQPHLKISSHSPPRSQLCWRSPLRDLAATLPTQWHRMAVTALS